MCLTSCPAWSALYWNPALCSLLMHKWKPCVSAVEGSGSPELWRSRNAVQPQSVEAHTHTSLLFQSGDAPLMHQVEFRGKSSLSRGNSALAKLCALSQKGQSERSICQLWQLCGCAPLTLMQPFQIFFQAGSVDLELIMEKRFKMDARNRQGSREIYVLYLSKIKCRKV